MQRLLKFIVRIVMRFYLVIIIAAIALAAVGYPRTKAYFSNINTDLTELIPEHYNSVKTINEIRDKFKSKTGVILIIEDKDPETARRMIHDLAGFLEGDPDIEEVEFKKRGYEFFDKHKLLFADLEDLKTVRDRIDRRIQREKIGSLYIDLEGEDGDEDFKFGDIESKYKSKYSVGSKSDYYTNDSQTLYSVYVYPSKEPEGVKQCSEFYELMKKRLAEFDSGKNYPSAKIYVSGPVRTRVEEYNLIIRDLGRAGLISGIGIALVLMLYFRRVFAVGILFVPLSIGIVTTFAFSSLFIKNLNLVTSFLFAVLGGLGVEIGIHILSRYIEERRAGRNMEEALFTVLYRTGGSALTSAAAVAATFWILVINDFKGFSEFGFIAGSGLIINYLFFMILFPALLVLAEKVRLLKFRRAFGFEFKKVGPPAPAPYGAGPASRALGQRAGSLRFPYARFVLVGIGVLAIVSAIDLPHLGFEWRFSKIKANIPEAREAKAKQRETSSAVNSPAMVIVHSREEADAVRDVIDERMKNPDTSINAYKSYYDLMPSDQAEKLAVVGEMQGLLADKTLKIVKGEHKKDLDKFKQALSDTDPIEESEIPPKVKDLFWGEVEGDDTQVAYINPLPHMEMDDGRNAIRFSKEIEEIKTPYGSFYPSNDSIIFANVLLTMIKDGKRVMLLAFAIVFIIVLLDFRRISTSLLVISPIALGVLLMTGFMYVLKLKLNFYNIVVAATVVGTSIDNSVHIYHRYKEMGRGSLMAALRSSGGASLMSSLTNIFGFLGLAFASHSGLRTIGDLAVTGMMACLFTTLIYFPALLQYMENRKGKDSM